MIADVDLHRYDATHIGKLIASRELTSTEVTSYFLSRIERLDRGVGAYVTVTRELAMSMANEADKRLASDPTFSPPPLFGVPVSIKDNLNVEDVVTTWGSRDRINDVANGDDNVVTLLKDAHQPILGKTQLPEFALPCHGQNMLGGDTRNPWNPDLTPGGSSSGAAAAVAAGLSPIAIGTDAGGSVRIPAACCGIVGFRPTTGAISTGYSDASPTLLSSPGILARSGRDVANIFKHIAADMPGDIFSARRAPDSLPSLRGLRVGVARSPMLPGIDVDPPLLRAVDSIAKALRSKGAKVIEVDLGEDLVGAAAFREAWSVVAASFDVVDENSLTPFTKMLRNAGREISGVQFHNAVAMFRGFSLMLEQFVFSNIDILITPTLAKLTPRRNEFTKSSDEEVNFESMSNFMPFTPMYNISGMPSVSVPAGFYGGVPLGVMLGTIQGQDDLLLEVVGHLVSPATTIATDWI